MQRAFAPIKNISKAEEVFLQLRDEILSGNLKPGMPLREAHLARDFHVSQVPVREALLQLEHLGLVIRTPDKGTKVTQLSRSEMLELWEVRAHLEDLAFRLAAKNLNPEMMKELEASLAELKRQVKTGDSYSVAQADLHFHQTVWRHSGNRVLQDTLERLCASMLAFTGMQRRSAGERPLETVQRHVLLLDALKTGKIKTVSAAIRNHLEPKKSLPPMPQE